jgi:hypothetical protein
MRPFNAIKSKSGSNSRDPFLLSKVYDNSDLDPRAPRRSA